MEVTEDLGSIDLEQSVNKVIKKKKKSKRPNIK
jgi:hypothetical protein